MLICIESVLTLATLVFEGVSGGGSAHVQVCIVAQATASVRHIQRNILSMNQGALSEREL